MRVTIAHTFDFQRDRDVIGGELTRPDAWDAARSTIGGFRLPESREEWERLASRPELERRAAAVVDLAHRLGARTICSHGVGTGTLELNLHRIAPELDLTCTDFAPRTTERLRRLFPEARVVVHDLATQEPPAADLQLMYRIDTELDTDTWRRVLARYSEPVLMVPVLLLDLDRLVRELVRRVVKPRATRAGWIRSEDALQALWTDTHEHERVAIADMPAFLLRRRAV